MINKNQINNKAIEAANQVKQLKQKYNISAEDAAELHKAFAVIHGEHILLETQKVLKECEGLKNPFPSAKFQLDWIVNHLSIHFKESVKRAQLARL